MSRGRKTIRTAKLVEEILRRIADGESLRSVCRSEGMPSRETVREWLDKDPDLAGQYARAVSERADVLVEDMLEIADAARGGDAEAVQAAKLRVDTRKWVASKMAPRRYGDRAAVELSGPAGGPVQVESIVDLVKRVSAEDEAEKPK